MTRTEKTYFIVFPLYWASAWFLAPIYPLFLLSRGLDLFEINLILACYMVTIFVFEIPTGAIADLLGRKASFLLSCGIRACAYVLYASAEDFGDCLTAELIDGFGTTLASGSLEAWAVDGMKAEGHRGSTDRFFARAQIVSRTVLVCCGITSGYLALWGLHWPWLVGASGFVVTAAVGFVRMEETRPSQRPRRAEAFAVLRSTMFDGLALVRASAMLKMLCLVTGAAMFAALPAHMFWQPRLTELSGEGTWLMGWIWAGLNVTAAAGSAALPILLARFSRETVLALSSAWRAALLGVAAGASTFTPAATAFLAQEAGFGLNEPVLQGWTNEHVSAERRATVLSVRSMFGTLGASLGLVLVGLAARAAGIPVGWALCAIAFAATIPGYLWLGRIARVRIAPVEEPPPVVEARVVPPAGG